MVFLYRVNKKGAIEVQFNWVFIMIAGAVIMIFFINLAQKHVKRGEVLNADQILSELGSVVTNAQSLQRTASIKEVRNIDLEMRCNYDTCDENGCESEFDYGGMGITAPAWLDVEVVFSPRYIRGDHLLTWSLEFDVPYRVTNFLYITSDSHRYVVVYDDADSGFAESLYKIFKQSEYVYINKTHIDSVGKIKYHGEANIRYVLVGPDSLDINMLDDTVREKNKFDVIFIDGNMNSGMVKFPRYDPATSNYVPGDEYPYFTMPMIFGAIYSEDILDYKCNVEKAFLRMRKVNSVYSRRISRIRNYYSSSGNTDCANLFGSYISDKIDGLSAGSADFDGAAAAQMVSFMNGIRQDNKVASNNCAGVY